MKNILILGSLLKNETDAKIYKIIIQICKAFAENVDSPIDTAKFNEAKYLDL